MKAKIEYVGGMSLESCGVRNYNITIIEGKHEGRVIQKQVITPKDELGNWSLGESTYLIEGEWVSQEVLIEKLQ